ncbi:hypothetical protein C8F04DRAFT_1233739 [Mycena alexandri]|uniref:Arrestin-like N-terminal domain-containing protein n=1 Tax=Mycena alexandri TaxID=1745969 RepID=A0AAD6X7T7_9AGAR|nr:hypothetical protein C8F04DRAFT_1233739 [Mycena alexandri]
MAAISRPEPMNATSHHSKVKVSMTLGNPVFVAGSYISGKMEMECRADKGLGIGVMMVELFAIQELTSRDHSATSTFLHSRRLFQGPGLPPSNAVQPHPVPGEPLFPAHYHQARRGQSTFLFKFPLPSSSPSSITFGGDLARVRYELRASVGVLWKGEKRLVMERTDIQVVECFTEDPTRPEPEGVVVAENGKIWAQGKVVGGVIVAGESACVELQVKNHSTKKNSGLVITLTRTLVLSGIPDSEKQPLQISDTLVTVPFRGQEYIIPPGAEGVASLVFDVPKHARGVKGGLLQGDESVSKPTPAIFEVRCVVGVKMTMGFGTKDIELDLPVTVVHPSALPDLPPPQQQQYDYGAYQQPPYYGGYPMSPPLPGPAYIDPQQAHVWLPPPISHTPQPYGNNNYYTPQPQHGQQQYYFPPPPTQPIYQPLPLNLARPLSAGANPTVATSLVVPGQEGQAGPADGEVDTATGEEGKGARASRISAHLRQSTRNRSASPLSHRYPLAAGPATSAANAQTLRAMSVLSPRPVLSPKASFADSGATKPTSERVEDLERMAAEVAAKTSNLSGDLPKSTILADASPSGSGSAVAAENGAGNSEGLVPPGKSKERRKSKSPSKSKRGSREKDAEKQKEKSERRERREMEKEREIAEADLNKTLPGPPVPTGKTAPPAAPRTRVDTYFDLPTTTTAPASAQLTPQPRHNNDSSHDELFMPVPAEQTPKTPTLTAMRGRPPATATAGGLLTSESGLDALERRLLIEVGTRKMPAAARPDARSVLAAGPSGAGSGSGAMDIPMKRADSADDSAISSLTLAGGVQERERERQWERERGQEEEERDRDSDERTQGAKKSSSGRTERGGGDGEQRRSGRRKDKDKEKPKEGAEPRKMRKAAKGRVAAWLGGIDPEVPPDADVDRPPSPDVEVEATAHEDVAASTKKETSKGKEKAAVPTSPAVSAPTSPIDAAPNPRSSGFVPVKTFKRDPFQRIPAVGNPAEEARRIADLWSTSAPVVKDKSPVLPRVTSPTRVPQSVHTDRNVSPPSAPPKLNGSTAVMDGWKAVASPAAVPKKVVPMSPRLPAFPSPLDPEVKYDIRSARGGRGGKVTAVASLWASGALAEQSKDSTSKSAVASPKPTTTPKPVATLKPTTTSRPTTAAKPIIAPKPTTPTSPKPATAPKPVTAADFLRSNAGRSTPKSPLIDKAAGDAAKAAPSPAATPEQRVSRSAPLIKSASVPAIVSSSHARPTLSSTASLARPAPRPHLRAPPKPAPTIAESASEVVSGFKGRVQASLSSGPAVKAPTPAPAAAASKPGELAFGQAKLRDLIKKYQGATA